MIDEIRDAWREETRDHRIALVTIGIVAVALRLLYIGQPMRYDESVTYLYFAKRPLADALSLYTYPNNHLFHTLLVKASVAAFGNSPWALRLPAFLAGLLLVPATYASGRALYGARAALLAAGIVAGSGVLTLYSTNARGYTWIVLAFLLLVLGAARALDRRAGTREWIEFAVVAALGLWTIPVMLYPLGTVSLWIALSLLVDERPAELRRLGIALGVTAALTLVLYSPVLTREGLGAITRNKFVVSAGWFDFFERLPPTIREALTSWALGATILSAVLAVCAIVALRRHARVSRYRVGLPLAAFAWCAWLLVVNHRAPFARVWLWLFPLAAWLAGAGVVFLMERWPRTNRAEQRTPVIAVALSLVMAISVALSGDVLESRDTGTYRDAEPAAAQLQRSFTPGDRVLAAVPNSAPLAYYLDRLGVPAGYFTVDEDRAKRVVVVIDQNEGLTLEAVVGKSAVTDSAQFEPPTILATLPSSYLLLFRRRDAAAR